MSDLICLSSVDVSEAVIRVKSMYMIKSCFRTRKEKLLKLNKFLHESPFKRLFRHGIYRLLRRADARGSADIIYGM